MIEDWRISKEEYSFSNQWESNIRGFFHYAFFQITKWFQEDSFAKDS